jgi:predicted nucleic acid-binding protein
LTSQIIVDASPLIILIKSDLAYLLPKLFESVVVPDGVWQEVLAGDEDDVARNELPNLVWVTRILVAAETLT